VGEELAELRPQRPLGGRVGPARVRRRTDALLAIRVVEGGEGRPVEDLGPVELLDQALQIGRRDQLPGLLRDARLDLVKEVRPSKWRTTRR
jgi:hypothetical protein